MQVWRLNINPASDEDTDPRQFCFENDILGFGWPIGDASADITWEEYTEKAGEKYGDTSWTKATNALRKMEVGDLCWTRDAEGRYYLARVEGPWRYEGGRKHRKADVVNVRDCRWVEVGAPDAVPGKVVGSLNVGGTLQRVNGDAVQQYSEMLFQRLDETAGDSQEIDTDDLFSLISADDCEDLVGLYLQERGYRLIPSTCKKSTSRFEYVLKHRETGEKAYAQVKRGGESLEADKYAPDDGMAFLFTAEGNQKGSASNVEFIDPDTLRQFVTDNHQLLPDSVQSWVTIIE
jgi:ribosomal protein S18